MVRYPLRRREPRPDRVLTIEAGQVVCPRRGVVDLELCWMCPAYRGLSAGRVEGLVCGADPLSALVTRYAVPTHGLDG